MKFSTRVEGFKGHRRGSALHTPHHVYITEVCERCVSIIEYVSTGPGGRGVERTTETDSNKQQTKLQSANKMCC